MGYWGVKSYEGDDAADALDAGFAHVHGSQYEEMMDDRNSFSFEQVQAQLARPETLAAAIKSLSESAAETLEDWDDEERLAFVGVVVRHAELNVPIPDDLRQQALDWLEHEEIDWDDATLRRLRRQKEIELLRQAGS
ncbi:MAG TPA: hypothetical protein VGZ22_25770 [Isosphaeraceae bacterium]|jgi:hypothetical protein|nr:hypothetical protein [Isosphaeraceae bacterium]